MELDHLSQKNGRELTAAQAFFIKLGVGGCWENRCFDDGTIRLGFHEVPHELALKGNSSAIRQIYVEMKRKPRIASSYANQVAHFYGADENTLWITFASGKLWWAIAVPGVKHLESNPDISAETGSRFLTTLDGWHSTDLNGKNLYLRELSGSLTKTAGYRQTICEIGQGELDYLLRRINGKISSVVETAEKAKREMVSAIEQLLIKLGWKDFELLVDLVFAASGWRRMSAIGTTQKSIDMEMVLPTTGEIGVVQIKSKTTQKELNQYVEALSEWGAKRYFYVFHSSDRPLSTRNKGFSLIGRKELAELVLDGGLSTWLIQKVS